MQYVKAAIGENQRLFKCGQVVSEFGMVLDYF